MANAYLAVDQNLEIVPVVNKIDLPGAQPEDTMRQIEEIDGLDAADAIMASAKEGTGTRAILDAVIARVPPPAGDRDAPLKALIFDSWYDPYRGVIVLIRVVDGAVRPKMKVRLMVRGQDYEVEQVGVSSQSRGGAGAGGRGGRVRDRRHQDGERRPDWRHAHRDVATDRRPVRGLRRDEADGVRRGSTQSRGTSTPSSATRSRSCG